MQKASIVTILATVFYLVVSTASALAVSNVDFPACINPQGEVIADYPSGTHGIVGEAGTHTGSDKVYKVDTQKVMQCFCPASGSGIQTNWFKAGQLTDAEIAEHEKNGWIVVPNGALWGLDEGVYLAKNQSFSCNGSSNPSTGSTGTSSSGTGGGSSSTGSIGGSVLGLATTGNSLTLFGAFMTGITSLLLSFFLKKKQTN